MMSEFSLAAKIETILFWRPEPTGVVFLAKMIGQSKEEIEEALTILENNLSGRGIRLLRKDDEVILGTAPEAGELIEKIAKAELSGDLGKASLETLAIISYLGPISRAEIDWIRGVGSSYILRHLSVRGLVDREVNPKDQRSYLYQPSLNLMAQLGMTKKENFPDFDKIRQEIENFKSSFEPN